MKKTRLGLVGPKNPVDELIFDKFINKIIFKF